MRVLQHIQKVARTITGIVEYDVAGEGAGEPCQRREDRHRRREEQCLRNLDGGRDHWPIALLEEGEHGDGSIYIKGGCPMRDGSRKATYVRYSENRASSLCALHQGTLSLMYFEYDYGSIRTAATV